MILWSVLVFNLMLCGGEIFVNGEGYQAIPHLLRPYFEDNQVFSGGGFYPAGVSEDSGDFATHGRKGESRNPKKLYAIIRYCCTRRYAGVGCIFAEGGKGRANMLCGWN